jgi:replication-associated recombination protein RarA
VDETPEQAAWRELLEETGLGPETGPTHFTCSAGRGRGAPAGAAPLAARLRPRTLDDVVGQEHLVGPGRPLRRLVEQDRLTSAIFWGPPGHRQDHPRAGRRRVDRSAAFEQLSAVTAGVKDVREVIERARQRLGERGQGTILFLDEIHRFSRRSRTPCSRPSRTAR